MPDSSPERAAPRRRTRKTSPRVIWIDRITTAVITVGGAGVILAVLGILVYLGIVVLPLFQGGEITGRISYTLLPEAAASSILFNELDEYRVMGLYVTAGGDLVSFGARTGTLLSRERLLPPALPEITAHARFARDGLLALGLKDGSVVTASLRFRTDFPNAADPDDGDRQRLDVEAIVETPEGVLQKTPKGEIRRVSVALEVSPPATVGISGAAVALVDVRKTELEDDVRMAVLKEDGELILSEVTRRTNLLTGEVRQELVTTPLPFPSGRRDAAPPSFLLLASQGDRLFLGWRDGTVLRYDLRDLSDPRTVERADLVEGEDAELTALRFMPGEQSLISGDSTGRVRAWFLVPRPGLSEDGSALVVAHELTPAPSAITALGMSRRDKSLVAATMTGEVMVHHMTSEQLVAETSVTPAAPIASVQITPKADGLFALTEDGRASLWRLDSPHPETTLKSILGKIWYEGYPAPSFTWQSSSGTDDFEPKLSLVPLLFGTFKATLYSMLFAVPIALLAAIYTSEFLDRRFRAPLKSTIEVMASLPSVVLGFIAALVLAPLVENWVVATLTVFGIVPLGALAFGYLWQVLPRRFSIPLEGKPQILILVGVVVLSILAAVKLAGPVERLLFAGDLMGWLDGRIGSATPGSAILVWPVLLIGLLILDRRVLSEALERRGAGGGTPTAGALVQLVKFAVLVLLSLVLAWAIATVLTALGFDPRGIFVGTYVQRNALIVGFVMGFAVIPIIYTIAEDALSAVPETLRSASLGCGATRWQTATRVVLPVALSGIFSALMVGLGRAVGETMIVLMAAGNTPLLDLNIFNGLRTLSANIAVELPEAVKDGTLYRMLFFAALSLFVLTSVVNTIAEIVRQRFRKRAFQL